MIKAKQSEFLATLRNRRLAYIGLFGKENDLATDTVLKDLALFCRAEQSTFHQDARLHAVLEGRREVWLRIQEYLHSSEEQIFRKHKVIELKEQEDGTRAGPAQP